MISAQNDACVQLKAGSDRKDLMKLARCLVSHKVWEGMGQIAACFNMWFTDKCVNSWVGKAQEISNSAELFLNVYTYTYMVNI